MPTRSPEEGVTIMISRELHKQLRQIAFDNHSSIKRLASEALSEWLRTRTAEVRHG